ncbi:DUF4942 domain-containing protein [Prosthecochloris sp.]|uniref:DUF4942 domain-containing protein n=1 Tax=Prosthecochloris sp. TaxID=290513 RepID=UPI0025FB8F82|nr:DUF4942 domain-containing protein [Prosthecochloris sp.]
MMFDSEFFPTPIKVIDKMIAPLTTVVYGYNVFDPQRFGDDPQILEPSAGKGDILEKIAGKQYTSNMARKESCYAIELNPELQSVLHGKGYKVIDSDFLQHKPDYSYDIILMNPPFSNGDQHLLHAWEILEGGAIACVLNAETIRNSYTKNRQLLKNIIDQNGEVEFIGNAFSTAERKTNAEIAIVWLYKEPAKDRFKFDFTPIESESFDIDDRKVQANGEMAVNDFLGALLNTYDQTKAAFVEYLRAREAVEFYSRYLINDYRRSLKDLTEEAEKSGKTIKSQYNAFVTAYKREAWIEILRKLNIEKYMTSKVQRDFEEWKKQQGGMDLNRQNIHALMMNLVNNKDEIMKQACVEVFDEMTTYYKENRMVVEGWKTNDMWRVNRKVILPYAVERGWSGDTYRIRWNAQRDTVSDIDRVMAYLSGKNYDTIRRIEHAVEDKNNHKQGESEFFRLKWYKKGTLHLEWKDKDLWATFNQVACEGKNWLGTAA